MIPWWLSTQKDKVAITKISLEGKKKKKVVLKRKKNQELICVPVKFEMPMTHLHGNAEETPGYISLQLKGAV